MGVWAETGRRKRGGVGGRERGADAPTCAGLGASNATPP